MYIAAPYQKRDQAARVMELLEENGISVTSRWLKSPDEMTDEFARQDLADIECADLLLALNYAEFENSGTGGRHVELGYALALGKAVLLVGNVSNIFHTLSIIHRIDESDNVIASIHLVFERSHEK